MNQIVKCLQPPFILEVDDISNYTKIGAWNKDMPSNDTYSTYNSPSILWKLKIFPRSIIRGDYPNDIRYADDRLLISGS